MHEIKKRKLTGNLLLRVAGDDPWRGHGNENTSLLHDIIFHLVQALWL
jgi:hypothetical protein